MNDVKPIMQQLRDDPEIENLREKCHDITGQWPKFHFETYSCIEDYKKHMRIIIRESKN